MNPTSAASAQPITPSPRAGGGMVAVMGVCYALGTFADNFYKQAAILMAAAVQGTSVQSTATVLFSLPFVLFSAWAGWLADRAAKKTIVVGAKALELVAMLAGAVMLYVEDWTGIIVIIFLMGAQSTIFSPAINGSIPEYFPPERVPRVNSLIKLASTAAILAGMALAGVFLDLRPETRSTRLIFVDPTGEFYGRGMAGGFVILVSALGLVAALCMRRRPAAANASARFPLAGPLDSLRHILACRKDRELFLVLMAEAWFYGIAAIAVISIANLSAALGYSKTTAGTLSAMLMIGVATGSLLAGRGTPESWKRSLVPSASGMSVMLSLMALTPLFPTAQIFFGLSPQLGWMYLILFLCGLCGGIYLIPLASFIQVRPAPQEKGRVLGASNFLSFMAMAVFGGAFYGISLLPPSLTFLVYGLATMTFIAFYAAPRILALPGKSMKDAAAGPLGALLRFLLGFRYRVEETGLANVPAPSGPAPSGPAPSGKSAGPGVLFLPNHPALIDPVIVYSRIGGMRPRPLADERQMRGPVKRLAALTIGAVLIPDMEKDGRKGAARVRAGIQNITDALAKGQNVVLYPSGRIYRNGKEELRGSSAAARILAAVPDARVVLVRTTGLWGSSFSRASGQQPTFTRALARGVLAVLANALLFTPRRRVTVEFVEPKDLPRDGDKQRLNRYLEAFYAQAEAEAVSVPLYWWRKKKDEPAASPDEEDRERG